MGSFEYKINKSSNGDIQETETNYANTKVYLNNSEKLITHKDLLNKLKEQNNKNNVYVNTFESIIKERYKGIFQPKDKKYKRDLIKNLIEEFIRSVEGGNSKTSVDGIMDKVNFDYEDQETADQIGGAIESDYRNYLNLFRENKVNINESVDRSIEYYISEAPNIIKAIQPSFLGLKDVGSNYNFTNIKLLLKGIYDSISNVNYPKETETPPRPNHGAVNHMRTILFYCYILNKCKSYNKELYSELYKDKTEEVLGVIGSVFSRLLRLGEGDGGMEPDGGGYTGLEYDKWEKIFPKNFENKTDKKQVIDIIKDATVNISEWASSFLFLAIMKKLFDEKYHLFIEQLSF